MEKFVTICHHSYTYSKPPIIEGNEYYVTFNKGSYNVYQSVDDKNMQWISCFMDTFKNYFYTKGEMSKIREHRLKNILQ